MSTSDTTVIVVHNPPRRRRWSKEDPPRMRIVLLGKNVSENSEVGNFILGRAAFDSEAPPDVVERVGGRLKDRHVIIINSPQLLQTNISDHQITQTVRECVFLSDPGPHVIVLLLKHDQCSAEDQECVEKVLRSFSESVYQHTMVLTTQEPTETSDILQNIIQKCANRHFSLQRSSSPDDLLQTLEDIVKMSDGRHLDCAEVSEGVKLNLVVCGSDGSLKSSVSELILQQTDVELHGRQISVIELPALIGLSEEEVMRQTHRCVSLCRPGVHVFILIIPDGPINNEDKAETEKIQRIFSSRINKHIMILIKQDSEHQTAELNEETQSVIQSFGGRHQCIDLNTQVSVLMEKLVQMFEENSGVCFSTETLMETQMEKLLKFEVMRKKIHSLETPLLSQGSTEREDDLRIVLLGKTGVGKSSTGNTILAREAFTAETSQESVTKECQRETAEINSRHITVIDTPGLFDTELSNEEIQREISNSIPMILPGPHVFIIVLNLGQRFTQEEATAVEIIQETFGEKSLMFTMVLFTRGDFLENKTIKQCLGKPGSALNQLIEACGNRYHVFNNKETEDRTQVTDLLQKIDNMVKENGDSYYSCKMFREMEREIQEQQKNILMEKVEKLNKEREELMTKHEEEKKKMKLKIEEDHDKERKRKEEEFIEKEERYKRDIKDREEQERKIREELKREREEWKKQRLEEKMRREEEFNEREERYKTLLKEKEESEGKMREEMKREREQWKKWRLEEKKKRKEDEKRREREKQICDEQIQRLKSEMEGIIREKERIERERQEQLEDSEKRLKEERKMREDQQKTLEEKLKLLEEQHEEELMRRRVEWREEYEREKEMKICSETDHSLQGENKDIESAEVRAEKIQNIFDRLHLEGRQHNKLRAAEVLQITEHSLQSHESCAEEELIQTFLQKLLMMNYRARYIKTKQTNEDDYTYQRHSDSSVDEGDIFNEMSLSNEETNQSDLIDPMDVQMAVFYCADGLLKQLMVTKLSQCQYALPLLVPDPFTQQIEFPLWTFRQIHKSWRIRNTNNEFIRQTQPIYRAQTPMLFFFRFGSVSSSKSQLMNSLINEKHNTFFHRNCPDSSRTRVLMDGVVEITWFCPSGTNHDKFTECVAFCNLHGDAGDHEKQLQILTDMSSVNVVLLPQLDRNDRHAAKIQNLFKDRKPLICLFTEDESTVIEIRKGKFKIGLKDRNQSDVSEDLRRAINDCLSESSHTFRLEDVSKHSDIRVDEEDDEDCRRGRAAAQQMMSLLEKKDLTEIKESFLPHQGKLWHQWSQKNKELHRPRGDETEMDISRKYSEMKNIRQQQHESDISEFIKLFIKEMNSHDEHKMFFLKWLRILLDEYTSADLSALHHKYDKKWLTVLKLMENYDKSEQLRAAQTALERISEDLQAAVFGVEHIMREIGQIYESCLTLKKNKKDLQVHFSSLPSLAAEMMISGSPLELMDGDAAHVPVIWISAVLDQLVQKLGDQRVFVLSVLGIQSSGKSTMLNAMFGLQFAVGAGRCTRGAFMQLVRVSDEMKTQMNIDYILVVDTEGLRALDLAGRSTRNRDNELATFVVGLGNLTLINIFGENLAEMQDVLQIVVQAFMRMKKVRLNARCVFVHQNVSEVTAGEKNMEGRRRLLEKLDEMTKLAAKDEDSIAERFTDVITFDVQNDVKYFDQLWEGSPPMAPPNPNYCENIQELKNTVVSKASKSSGVTLSQFKGRINDLWNALLNENFVFSFRNILEIAAYRRLETKYNDWTWKLRNAMLKIEEKFHNRIANGKYEVEQKDLLADMNQTKEAVQKSFVLYFEEDRDREILSQWRGRFETKIKELHDDLIERAKRTLDEVIQQKKTREELDGKKTEYEIKLFSRSKELALKFTNTKTDEHVLKKEFDSVWGTWITELKTPPVKDIDIWKDVIKILSENHELPLLLERQHGTNYKKIDCLADYSDYIIQKKSVQLSDQDQSPNCADASSETQEGTSVIQKSRTSHVWSFFKSLISFGNRTVKENQHKPQSQNNTLLLKSEYQESVRVLIRNIIEQTSKILEQAQTAQRGYHDSYIQEMTACVQKHINEYQSENKKFRLKKEFSADLCLHVCDLAHDKFTILYNKFKNANDPKNYLERQKPQYYSVFKNSCKGTTTTAIFGKFFCSKLESSILQAVYNKTAIDLADLMKCDVPAFNGNRSQLEQHILKSLAEEENFQKYIKYIHNPREYFKHFIMCEVNKFINQQHQKVLTKFSNNLTHTVNSVNTAVQESMAEVKRNNGDAIMWQKSFVETLSDELKLTGNSCADLSTVTDFDFLEEVLLKNLKKMISKLQNGFKSINSIKMEKCRKKPDEILIDQLCQCCWIQCPFCNAICTGTVENHHGDHSVTFHRVNGLNGWKYRDTTFLSVNICTSAVASDRSFHPDSSDNTVLWREYRKGGDRFADWSITTDVSELPYWKWFVCRFQKDLEDYYENTFEECGEIPEAWRELSKDDAIQSLDHP